MPQRLERRENDRVWSLLLARRETDQTPNCASSTPSSAFVCLEVRVAGGEEEDNLRCAPIAPDAAGLTVWVRKKGLSTFQEVCTSDHSTRVATLKQGQTAVI